MSTSAAQAKSNPAPATDLNLVDALKKQTQALQDRLDNLEQALKANK